MLSTLNQSVALLQQWLFQQIVQPVMYAAGYAGWAEDAYDATEWFIYGVLEIALLYAILRPLELLRPVERWPDRREVGVDVIYTWLNRIGLLPLGIFVLLLPVVASVDGWLRMHDIIPRSLEDLFPALQSKPFASFLIYLLLFDFAEYWRHRLQHRFDWWWALHAVHHSQQRMSFWADSRNHVLDEVLRALWFAAVALLIGVPPGHYLGLVFVTRFVESLSHANLRLHFGRWGERLIVSPRYHRMHHAIGEGHEGVARGCNFAVLFPFWDLLFRTANFDLRFAATGIRDQVTDQRNYGSGFWAQQWLGITRLAASLFGR
ncbi:MAG: sterol desaturase family protein [Rhodocyclaceae bacterium]|nr:sterol desaturase family protein [Rhodocyclaceae bacterium]MBX3667089.1 sterol desaturase family protein [Rhodocyclaceae bacterium]